MMESFGEISFCLLVFLMKWFFFVSFVCFVLRIDLGKIVRDKLKLPYKDWW